MHEASVLQLTAAWTEPIQLLLKAPLVLSRGDLMPQRSGVLLVLQAQVDGAKLAGLGEVTPLPLFHKETLDEAESQLNSILAQWNSKPPKVPFGLGRLDGTLTQWLDQQCTGNLLPSVRAGLEMALLHLLRRVAPEARRPQRSDVSINSLLARDEDLAADTALVAKLKVGKEPLEDAQRTNQLAKLLLAKRPQARLRLDANRSWSLEQAASFINNLDEQALQITEYLEEPVEKSPQLLQHWEVLSEKTQRRLAFAVDESLTEGIVSTKDLENCKAPIKALVLKPSLQGLEQTAAMAKWAEERGAVAVLSSAFESGVALCHFALLASTMAPCWAEDVAQGFGTFTRLSEDVLEPPFADLVSAGSRGWQVNIGSCQEALDRSVEALVAARSQGTELVDGPSLAKKDAVPAKHIYEKPPATPGLALNPFQRCKELFSYNRESYKFDQDQRLEREMLRLEMQVKRFELFREDVRDLVELTVGRMDVYHLVGALFLEFCVTFFCEGRVQASAPPFILALFLLSNACAFVYLLIAVWLSMHASIASHSFGVRLLTRFVRLPIPSPQQIASLSRRLADFEKQGFQAPGGRFQSLDSRFQALGSKLQGPGSRLKVPSSGLPGFEAPGCRFQARLSTSRLQAQIDKHKLTRSQKRLAEKMSHQLATALAACQTQTDEELEACVAQAAEHKMLFASGPPGTGKTHVIHEQVRKWKRKGARVLFALPTGQLASEVRSIHPDIDVDTSHGAFLLHKPLQEAMAILTQYELVIIDEAWKHGETW
eukprot:s884_g43.t2